jgi:predicted permease
MILESLIHDVLYAVRGIRRSPLFAASVAGTIGLGLGILCSAFTIVNAYLLKPIDLPNPRQLYALSWDSAGTRYHEFRLADFTAMSDANPVFSGIAADDRAVVMDGEIPINGLLVTGNYFHVLGARAVIGRLLLPDDAAAPGARAVVVLSHDAWRSRYGADPAIVGKEIALGRHRFHVVGVAQPGSSLPGDETVSFWAPLTMARAFGTADPWSDTEADSLSVIGRLRPDTTESQARAWFDAWVRQRFPPGSDAAALRAHVDSRSTRIPRNPTTLTLFSLIVAAFALVLLVACANVTNMMLARGIERQREIAVRLSLGASRARVVRQLVLESLVLAVPAAAVGLGLTLVTARVFPLVVLGTLPDGWSPSVTSFLAPLDPDVRVLGLLFVSAVISAVLVGLNPAVQVTRASLAQVARGAVGPDVRVSRLRTGLVALQVAACVLFLVGATGLIDESRRLANPYTGLEYEGVLDVRVAEGIRADVAARLASDPSVQRVAAAWRPPLAGSLRTLRVVPAGNTVEHEAGFAAVSSEYFDLFGIGVRGRAFSGDEADQNAAVVVVSDATARRFWPGQNPIGQTLDILPSNDRERRPTQTRVRVVGVAEDVVSGIMIDGVDTTCVYFPTSFAMSGEMSILVRARTNAAAVMRSVSAAVKAVQPDATFRTYWMREMLGLQVWAFQAFSAAAALLGSVGLLLAFSGTYAVVAFLVTQRTREFGIRMALGATVRRIVASVLYDALRIAAVGAGAGLLAAAALARASDAVIETMPAFGPRPYVIAAAIVAVATIVAALVPSLRTSRIDPAAALRAE